MIRKDYEQFRPATGTWRSAGGRLRVRRTDYEGGSPRVRHTTARIRHLARRQCSGRMAARGRGAAARRDAAQRGGMGRMGVLMNLTSDDPEAPGRVAAFAQGLGELGWAVGRNVMIDYRWGAGDVERNRKYAAELVALAPQVILANSTQAVAA